MGWGLNADRQASPVPTNVMNGASSIAAGYLHSLAIDAGRVWAWGNNTYSQTNVPVSAQSGVTQVVGGASFSLARKTDGTVVIWGAGYVTTNMPTSATSGVSQVAAGEWHALALKDGGIIAWGSNSYGQCNVPASLTSGVSAISGGGYYSLALKDGGVQVFGIDATNELAYGIRSVPPAATSGVSAISAGRWHALALKDGGVVAWGASYDGTNSFYDATVVPAAATSGVSAIAAGDLFSIALKNDGTLVVWGDDTKGQFPVPAYASNGVTQIAAGAGHCMAVCPVMPARFTGASLPDAYRNYSYSGAVIAAGDPAVRYYPFGTWPAWVTLNSTNGAIGGTPPALGMTYFSVVASNIYGQVTNSYQINVLEFTGPPVLLTTNPLPSGVVGAYYSLQIVASNTPVAFSLVEGEGNLPDGLTMTTNGLVSGTPTTVQDLFFMVRVTNSFGASNRTYNISILPPAGPPVFVTTNPLPSGVVGQSYSMQIVASNYPSFSLLSGSLPDGLILTAGGLVTGTPTQVGSASFTVLATNLAGASNATYDIEILGPPSFTTTSPLPYGVAGVAYSQQIEATGDALFSQVGGTLPTGLSLATNGLLSGTPTVAGPYSFTVRATNAYGWTNRNFDLQIGEIPVFSTTNPLPSGMMGVAYSQQIVASGSPTFSLFDGSLPGGLNLSGAGLLSGTPSAAGSFNFTVRATNTYGWSNRVYDLLIAGQIAPQFTYIRVTNGAVRLVWTNYNETGNIQVWRTTSLTNAPVVWSNLGVQVSPWTNLAPSNPSYYRLMLVP